jgi:hypothetical protein
MTEKRIDWDLPSKSTLESVPDPSKHIHSVKENELSSPIGWRTQGRSAPFFFAGFNFFRGGTNVNKML